MVKHRDRPVWPHATRADTVRQQQSDLVRATHVFATLAAAFGVVALIGWALETPAFAGAILGQTPTTPLTAILIVLTSASLLCVRTMSMQRVGVVVAAAVVAITAVVLAEYMFAIDSGIERLVFADAVVRATGSSRLPAPNSALCLALTALALVLTPRSVGAPAWRTTVANTCAAVAAVIALAAVVGDSYGADAVDGETGYRRMALGSASAISLLAVAVLMHPLFGLIGRALMGTDAGTMIARRLLPATLLVPFVLGVVKRLADVNQWLSPAMGTALRTVTEMVVLVTLTLVAARKLGRIDRDREQLMMEEHEARADAERTQVVLEEQAQELEEQTVELEATVDELRLANDTLDEQRAIAEEAQSAELQAKRVLDAVIEQSPVGIVLAKIPSGEVVRRNKMGEDILAAFARVSGGSPRDTLTWHRGDGSRYTQGDFPLQRAVRLGELVANEEMTARLSDGSPVHVSVSAAPVYEDGSASLAVAVFVDISTRRAAESALAERDALLRSLFRAPDVSISVVEADLSDEALAMPNVDYRFLIANEQAARILGKTESQLAGLSGADLGIDAASRRTFVDLLASVHRAGKPTTVERPHPMAGQPAHADWYSIIVSPLSMRGDRLPRFCLIGTDISRRRHLEEELRQAQKLEAVGRLAGGIAHDFNNLLTAITGFTRFALSDLPAEGSAHDDLEQVMRAAERAGALTHQLLAFSRQQVLQPQVLDLNQVVSDIEPMLRRVIGEDIAIHPWLAASLGTVRADRGQIEQVLVNLIVNARDAMPDGGHVTIETADVFIEPSQAAVNHGGTVGPHVMLAVTDTGVGMSPETRERIFEPFFTTKETGRGTGLGLATVFGIVRQSGGSIWVYSEPGHGTTFKIYLPRFDGPPEAPRTSTPVSVPRVAGRVLLVEDDTAVRTIAARVLRSDGYDVVEATTGREGVETFKSLGGKFELILTDLVLPEMGGRAMIQALTAQGQTPPIIYMSGYTAEAMSAQSVLETGDQFIEKPFTPDSLLAKVRQTMQSSASQARRAG